MLFKFIGYWNKIPQELKDVFLWAIKECLNKDPIKVLLKAIEKLPLSWDKKEFITSFVRYAYNDGKIDISEAINLSNQLFRMLNCQCEFEDSSKYYIIKIVK
jgi:hypothetical protein